MEMKKEKDYVSPLVRSQRVEMEASIADTTFSVQLQPWSSDDVIGDAPGEGGDIWVAWD